MSGEAVPDLVSISSTEYNRLMTIKKVTESHHGVDRLAFLQAQGGEVIWHESQNTAVLDMDVVKSTRFTRALHKDIGGATRVKIELQILHNALIQEAIKYGSSVHLFVGDS